MPYSVWLTRHRRYEDVQAGAPDSLTLEDMRTCLACLGRSRPTLEVRRPDGSTWVFRRGEPPAYAPLLKAGVRPNNGPKQGTVQLSVSLTSPFFLANLYELLTLAALLSEQFDLNAYEGVHGQQVTVETLEALTRTEGPYVRKVGRQWVERREQLHKHIRMPLELPAGQEDEATNLLALRLRHPRLPPLEQLLAAPPGGQGVDVADTRGLWFDKASDTPRTWFMLNPHAADELLVWPHWGEEPFLQTAHSTFAAAERLRERAGGQVLWNGQPATARHTSWLHRYPGLLGVELLQLVLLDWEPSARPSTQ